MSLHSLPPTDSYTPKPLLSLCHGKQQCQYKASVNTCMSPGFSVPFFRSKFNKITLHLGKHIYYNLLSFIYNLLYTTIFMHKFHYQKLPSAFNHYFTAVNETHAYNTRLASKQSYSLPKTRTNFGIFNIRYQGPKIWNSLDETDKNYLISN